ncbi:MAG TPA: hypothetical protein PLU79_16620, partial [Burkholderiaceae bacterium]|nr:hypothetical protein [Burkholderiaceae bacterium]
MYLLSQLWLYLVLACLAGAAFAFALRVVCARRAQAAQLQGLRDEARRVDAAHAAELAALRSEHDEALASLRADLTASAAQATALQTRVERLSDDHRQASGRLGLLDAELLTQRADKARLATELQQAAAQATEVGQALDALRADHAALLQASQTERDALQERLAAVQADHATLTARQTATAGDLSAAQRRAEGLAADLDLARTRAEQLEAEQVRLRDVQADEAGLEPDRAGRGDGLAGRSLVARVHYGVDAHAHGKVGKLVSRQGFGLRRAGGNQGQGREAQRSGAHRGWNVGLKSR